ncbi:DUF5994 family protein [Amycolatopsis carbonis]|uniref:DUF5994 family protein n=1 Tax=Amycolatopsis carbonis TaxID=715471 RepID=A0A9Y2MU00_9PSEU|nr:DUF5994 family protein [Amycolatopsis sp. 2-15]WIX75147.1 DUF5994 family protein [Amycolatopsis sp. 2-15]
MKQAGAERGHVDGGRWPRATDLAAELPSLATALEQRDGNPSGNWVSAHP